MVTTSKVFRAVLQTGLLIALLSGCGDSGVEDVPKDKGLSFCDNIDAPAPTCLDPSFDATAQLQSCATATCHGSSDGVTSWTLDLSNGAESALAALVGEAPDLGGPGDVLIDASNVDCSYMLAKVNPDDAQFVSGAVMPTPPTPAWSAGEVDCFRKFLHDNLAN